MCECDRRRGKEGLVLIKLVLIRATDKLSALSLSESTSMDRKQRHHPKRGSHPLEKEERRSEEDEAVLLSCVLSSSALLLILCFGGTYPFGKEEGRHLLSLTLTRSFLSSLLSSLLSSTSLSSCLLFLLSSSSPFLSSCHCQIIAS